MSQPWNLLIAALALTANLGAQEGSGESRAASIVNAIRVEAQGPDGGRPPGARLRAELSDGRPHPVTLVEPGVWSVELPRREAVRVTISAPGLRDEGFLLDSSQAAGRVVVKQLGFAEVQESVEVNAAAGATVDPEATGTRATLSAKMLEQVPVPLGSRGIETYLLTLPGFAMNANGAIHPRGAHNQMTFVIDGMTISDQLTAAFATALDPNLVDSLELYTGDIPAEFGAKVSGVAVISSRTAAGSGRRLFGSAEVSGGRFDTLQGLAQAGGERGRWAYFGSVYSMKSHRFLDQVSLDNLHNGGNAERAFFRLDGDLGAGDRLRFNAMAGRSSFELANLRSQQGEGMRQRQKLEDASVWLHWSHTLDTRSTYDSTFSYRATVAWLYPSTGDTPVTASQARHLSTVTWAHRYSRTQGRHAIRAGADVQAFPVSENFSLGITDAAFNVPGNPNFNASLLPHDLTRGGRLFQFSDHDAGWLGSGFVQDSVKLGDLVLSLGVRYDRYHFLVRGHQLQPRVGAAYHVAKTGTVFRVSYNRNYQTPPNENLLLSSSEAVGALAPESVKQALGNVVTPIRSQRENVYEAGMQQAVGRHATLNVSVYHKNSVDQQDNNNFFNTGIIFPVTLAKIRVNGAEARFALPEWRGVTASVSATHARAISTPPFTGGLFLGQDAVDLLSAGPFVIDHDQKLSVETQLQYTFRRNWWFSNTVRYDSGLVANPSDPAVVAADPDYRDLLPYVNLLEAPARVRPRTITDFAAGYRRFRGDRRVWEVQGQLNNAFSVTALYNFQSVFVGTRLVAPRSAGVKFRVWW